MELIVLDCFSSIRGLLFSAELKPRGYYLEHVFYLDCVEFYLSHVLTKFLIVGRALCTKNQSL